ncbi:MAG: hypothetical protein HY319_25070 [Armatimonadetes bacterium]|nr:hypothetical protein [Armatimonadota bacterium]
MTIWEYETVQVFDCDPEEMRDVLEPLGQRGFQLLHVRNNADLSLLMIFARDTGRPVEVSSGPLQDGFTDSQMELMAVNWSPSR